MAENPKKEVDRGGEEHKTLKETLRDTKLRPLFIE